MSVFHAIILGITQGLSEFLPISSSGHLRLVPWLLGWHDFDGRTQLEQTFDVALHLGTLLAAVAYFWRDLKDLAVEGLGGLRHPRDMSPTGRLWWLLLASVIPAGIAGSLFEDTFAKIADREWVIGLMLIVFGVVLLWTDQRRGPRDVDAFAGRDAALAGSAEVLALVPGVSRSGASISALRLLGFSRDAAIRLSFLMLIPITGGAVVTKAVDLIDNFPPGFAAPFAWGVAASAITGFGAVWFTLRVIRTHTFRPFVIYRLVVGVGVLVVAFTGLR